MQAKSTLKKYGIKSIESKYVSTRKEALDFAGKDAIVLKLLSEKALHKTKAGLVKLNLKSDEISKAFDYLETKGKQLKPYKIIAQKMANSGIEIIIGARVDKQFGKVLMIGLGGIYVETFKDVALRIVPISDYDALSMVNQLKSKNVITHNGSSTKMITELLIKTSKMFASDKKLTELDLNPIIIREKDYDVVDIRMIQ